MLQLSQSYFGPKTEDSQLESIDSLKSNNRLSQSEFEMQLSKVRKEDLENFSEEQEKRKFEISKNYALRVNSRSTSNNRRIEFRRVNIPEIEELDIFEESETESRFEIEESILIDDLHKSRLKCRNCLCNLKQSSALNEYVLCGNCKNKICSICGRLRLPSSYCCTCKNSYLESSQACQIANLIALHFIGLLTNSFSLFLIFNMKLLNSDSATRTCLALTLIEMPLIVITFFILLPFWSVISFIRLD